MLPIKKEEVIDIEENLVEMCAAPIVEDYPPPDDNSTPRSPQQTLDAMIDEMSTDEEGPPAVHFNPSFVSVDLPVVGKMESLDFDLDNLYENFDPLLQDPLACSTDPLAISDSELAVQKPSATPPYNPVRRSTRQTKPKSEDPLAQCARVKPRSSENHKPPITAPQPLENKPARATLKSTRTKSQPLLKNREPSSNKKGSTAAMETRRFSKHRNSTKQSSPPTSKNLKSNKPPKKTKLLVPVVRFDVTCNFCQRTFKHKPILQIHIQQLHCSKTRKEPSSKKFRCSQCPRRFIHQTNLIKHTRTLHRKQQRVWCAHCKKSFKTKYSLIDHMHRLHPIITKRDPAPRRYKCTTCGKRFNLNSLRLRHERNIHGEHAKPRRCPHCGKTLKNLQGLLFHVNNYHEGEKAGKTLNCPHCKLKFGLQKHLKRHVFNTHGDGAKKQICRQCKQTFKNKRGFDRHIKIYH